VRDPHFRRSFIRIFNELRDPAAPGGTMFPVPRDATARVLHRIKFPEPIEYFAVTNLGWVSRSTLMRTTTALLSAAAIAAIALPGTADAASRYHHRYAREPVIQQASVAPVNPLGGVLLGAGIGAIIGAAVCPPCAVAGSALTSGGGALVGAGIGAVAGGVVVAAAAPPPPPAYW
jgi:hypothetical protein